ncbi:MAG TPA: alpha/beta hydrolase [Ferruginibacter sp.]|nr:alpha/beta hydrolase [Ferruginibacter sp.]
MKKYLCCLLAITIILSSCFNEMTGTEDGSITAGNLSIYFENTFNERTKKNGAVVLLHAGLQDHTMWDKQVKELSKEYQVIVIDLPYHGRSMGSDTTILAADVIKLVLDNRKLQKVSIAGLSMGASVAQDFVIAYPQRVNKAIFISAGINGYEVDHPIDSISSQWWPHFQQALEKKDTATAAKEFTKAWAEGVYRSADSLKAPVSQYVYKTTLENLRKHKMEAWPLLQSNPVGYKNIASIKVPVLIIDGDKDLPYIAQTSAYLENNIPGAKRITIKDVAHMLNMEKPGEVNKAILEFLKAK